CDLPTGDRYQDLGFIGAGGMGEVRRVVDRDLNRVVAMKIMSPKRFQLAFERFVREAQVTAQLQHPGIVPVYQLGQKTDGRYYFTMREVKGRTFKAVIEEVHQATSDQWETTKSGWTFRRLIHAFFELCRAVGYAHSRGVVHRDLKPSNVMIGAHGEVLVVDWGLAKVFGHPDLAAEAGKLEVVVIDDGTKTRTGSVEGTPAYMPPEQAMGEVESIDSRSDVYSLGAVLYNILTGHAPYQGRTHRDVLRDVIDGPPVPLHQRHSMGVLRAQSTISADDDDLDQEVEPTVEISSGPSLPPELVDICNRAMSRAQDQRYGNGSDLAEEIEEWLDGRLRREKALAEVERALGCTPRGEELRRQARQLRTEASQILAQVRSWEPEEVKLKGWSKEDQAAKLEHRADLEALESDRLLHAALTHAPDLPEAHKALADRYRQEHQLAEQQGEDDQMLKAELLLRGHAQALPDHDSSRLGHFAYLRGDGAVTLITDLPGAKVRLHRYITKNRHLVPVLVRELGVTPLFSVPLPMGSYLCELSHPGRITVKYPVFIDRQAHWNGVPPQSEDSQPIWLPPAGELEADECYVSGGWYFSGGDVDAADSLPGSKLWVDSFVIQRFPVTNRQYVTFLNDLLTKGREDDALRWAPRVEPGREGEEGAMIYGRDSDGRFRLVPDGEGDHWFEDWPVLMVDWWCATAFARWLAATTGKAWRLPNEVEWEKAARGADRRIFPWGAFLDPSWTCMRDSHEGRQLPAVIQRFPMDESPYGVRGMGGNVRDWCNGYPPSEKAETAAVVRGGGWSYNARITRVTNRYRLEPWKRKSGIGFRLVRDLPNR
ncbi:MAG: SUMF1/EgtB/PvdO family nonheme iron enzyme, partial [Proteobacteria bacterium]|nr:SUMF1/EgtB/PvdO family nonheme iron enzyme [Pseudomonadota bacterium]